VVLPPLAAAAVINAAAGTLFSWSVLLPALATDFSASSRVVASTFSTAIAVFAVAVVAAGPAVDRYGPHRTAAAAGVLCGAGLTVTALAQHLVVLHVGYGLLFGAGSALAYLSVVTWASTRTGGGPVTSVGVVLAAYAAGPVLAGPVAGQGMSAWGWRPTVLLGAGTVTATIVLASRLLPDAIAVTDAEPGTPGVRDRPALAALWLLFLAGTAPGLFAFTYAASLATDRGLPPHFGGLAVAAMGSGNLVGRLLAGALTDRVGLRWALRADLALLGVGLAALAWLPGRAAVLLALPAVAVQYGALSTLLPTAVRRVCEPSRFGSAYGLVFSSWGLAGVLAPVLRDPAGTSAAALGSWLPLTAAVLVGLVAYERRLAKRGG
jgi:OFA family oxalate/formate antiporter-like MFS transporter